MKLIEDNSNYSYNIGTNPAGGGSIWVAPKTPTEREELARLYDPRTWDPTGMIVFRIPCRRVRHVPNPHDDGLNPVFVELVRRYGWRTKGYPQL